MEEYPIGSRVILTDLSKTEFNGLIGIVKSKLNQNGRQQISLIDESSSSDDNKMLGLKPINLKLEPRPLDSLSTREMKTVLSRKDYEGSLAGFDKSELKSLVEAHVTCPNEIATILATSNASKSSDNSNNSASSSRSKNKKSGNLRQQMQNQASQLGNLSPAQMRQQAQMLRTMNPSMIRRMNPAMANFTDAQIQMAASQMEAMANNPQMVQGMVDQMNNMDDDQLETLNRMQTGAGANGGYGASSPSSTAVPSSMDPATGMQNMANMTPDQLRQQAAMMKSMSKETLRSMNPLMANWPDSQIDMAINQMETMANNPEMTQKMVDQMKNMKPEEIEKLQKMAQTGGTEGVDAMSGFDPKAMSQDPMQMLKNTNPAQIKQMLQMVKENPSLFKDMMRSANPAMADKLTDDQIAKTMESFANLDERKIGWIMGALGFMQSARDFVKKRGILLILLFICFCMVLLVIFVSQNGKTIKGDDNNIAALVTDSIDHTMTVPEIEEDEF